jgi:hypothetical protein
MWLRALVSVLAFTVLSAWPMSVGHAACPERPACEGCGCKGGPGYRGPDQKCVGFKNLDKVCGTPPTRCVFENAPGTGLNRECAMPAKRLPADAAK